MEDDELGGTFFFVTSDICFVVMAGSERGALQGGSKLLDSPKKHIHRKLDFSVASAKHLYNSKRTDCGVSCVLTVHVLSRRTGELQDGTA
jgi:hypothetical protein